MRTALRFLAGLALVAAAACGGEAVSPTPPERQPPADAPLAQRWRAVSADGSAIPLVAYDFPGEPSAGEHTRFLLDSAKAQLGSDGTWRQETWYSEWRSPAPGRDFVRLYGYALADRGTWTRSGTAITMESGWFQNRVIRGELGAGSLELQHGLGHSDPLLRVRYTLAP